MIQKTRGRPRTFDPAVALEAATLVFLKNGYDGTSLDDLTAAMKISRPSLYAAFGDKRALFLAALDNYGVTQGSSAIAALDAEPDITPALKAFFDRLCANGAQRSGSPGGCLVATCGGVLSGETDVGDRLRKGTVATRDHLAARFERESDAGALPADFPALARASLAVEMMHGIAFRARIGETLSALKAQTPDRVSAILG